MNVLVTGGTGFVGRELLRQLRIGGHRVHLLARHPQSRATREVVAQYGALVHPGDVLDTDSLRSACQGVAGVIHLVGIISEIGRQTFENIHVRGTQNLLFAAQDAGVGRFVHMSALGSRPEARSRYHQSKWAAEERVRRSGLGWTIFRPSIIYGPGDAFVNLFANMIRLSPIVPVIGGGRARFQPVAVKAVASALVKALTESRAIGETYDLCGPETLALDELVERILLVMRKKRLLLHVPPPVARCQAAVFEFVFPRLFRRAPPLTQDQLIMLLEDNTGNGRPANERFGLKPMPFEEGIAGYLK